MCNSGISTGTTTPTLGNVRDDLDEHGRASKPDPADELDELMYERFARAEYDKFHNYLNRLHDEIFALRRQLANARKGEA